MSLRLEMMQVARLAPRLLGESGALVRDFLLRQQNSDGGFRDRAGKSDLYYTVFGLDSLLALETSGIVPATASGKVFARAGEFVRFQGAGDSLDFVHLCCLARGWAAVEDQAKTDAAPPGLRAELARKIGEFRAADGGFNPVRGSATGTAYGAFLALGGYQDSKTELPEPLRLVQSLK
ncbi:MAG TPA: prenyltransferase/squalene oxidase repeat-containing protein, partial [Verrucomicrobiae bacterium]|nr:prenyltransferase/squalene oxidase repeat-containing protein [Verrucomicrobiae bacterium]